MIVAMSVQNPSNVTRPRQSRWLQPLWLPLVCGLCLQTPAMAAEALPLDTAPAAIEANAPLAAEAPVRLVFEAPAQLAAEAPAPAPSTEAAPQEPAGTDAPAAEAAAGFDMSNFAWRHGQLQLHQALGLSTLVGMAVTGGLGYWLAQQNGSSGVMDAHLLMAGLTTGLYLTSATLALTVPARPPGEPEGPWDTVAIHRNLAWLHAAGLISTITLGLLTNYNSLSFSQFHAIAGYTTIGLMALSAGVIAFGE
jgi:uncharacterized membrane protein